MVICKHCGGFFVVFFPLKLPLQQRNGQKYWITPLNLWILGFSVSSSQVCKIKEPANLKAETVFSQGSFLGLNLKLLFGTVIKNYNTFHSYTDGTQLYLSFPSNLAPVHTLSCTDEINCWMSRYYFIELNRNKTFIFVVTPRKSGILLWRSGE